MRNGTVPTRRAALAALAVAVGTSVLTGCATAARTGAGGGSLPAAAPTAPVAVPARCPAAYRLGRPAPGVPPATPQDSTGPDAGTAGPSPWPTQPGSLPPGFRAAWALRCDQNTVAYPGEGRWNVLVEQRAEGGGLDALVTALRRPWAPPATGPCPAMAFIPPYVVLVDAQGRAYWPALPRDGCGQPEPAATRALNALPWRTVREIRLHQVDTAEGVASGCPSGYKDMITLLTARAARTPGTRQTLPLPTSAGPVGVCVYTDDPTADPTMPVGTFRSGGTLPAAGAARVLTALAAAPAAGPCTARHTRFAVITISHLGPVVYLELDGCHRYVADSSGYTGAPDPAIARLIESVHA